MCALKVSDSTVKERRMSAPAPRAAVGRSVRLLRLAGALAVMLAALAIFGIANGRQEASGPLIAAAIAIGAGALVGLAIAARPFLKRKKNEHDLRP